MIPLKETLPFLLALTLGGSMASGQTHTIPPQTQTVMSFNVSIPWGSSTATLGLAAPQNLGPLSVLYTPSAQCRGFQISLETYNRSNPLTPTFIQNNKFLSRIQPVGGIKFNFVQQLAQIQQCQVMVVQDRVAPSPAKRTLLGSLKYSGGFQGNLTFELASPVVVEKVEVFKPQYCQNIDIVDSRLLLSDSPAPTPPPRSPVLAETATPLATVPEHAEFIEATERSEHYDLSDSWYTIPLAAPTKIRGITFSIAGPEAQTCEFPVYGWVH